VTEMGLNIIRLIEEVLSMLTTGATFVVMTTLKLATMGGVVMGLITGFQYFHNYEYKPNKKGKGDKGGESDVSDAIESLHKKSRSLG
jgi:hypothetical protein